MRCARAAPVPYSGPVTLAHDVAGTGPAVLLLHSTVCDRRMWDPQVPALVDAGYQVARADLRGYGDSPLPDAPYDEAQDVLDLLDGLDLGRVALVGASGGGRVALAVAARWPDRVAGLALLCTATAEHEPSPELRAFAEREEALLDSGDVAGATELNADTWLGPHTDATTREKVRAMQRHAFEVQLAASPETGPLPEEPDLSAITAPTLLVCGAHDLPDFRTIAVDLAARLPGARLIELDWAGHLPSLERPELVNAILVDFLDPILIGSH
jgi:3-oxoadipate enol-lactonase